jgi:hypothetical protein
VRRFGTGRVSWKRWDSASSSLQRVFTLRILPLPPVFLYEVILMGSRSFFSTSCGSISSEEGLYTRSDQGGVPGGCQNGTRRKLLSCPCDARASIRLFLTNHYTRLFIFVKGINGVLTAEAVGCATRERIPQETQKEEASGMRPHPLLRKEWATQNLFASLRVSHPPQRVLDDHRSLSAIGR